MQLNLQGKTLELPESVLDVLADADATDLRVLLYLAGNTESFREADAAEALQISEAEVRSSVKFWRGAGVIVRAGAAVKKEKTEKKPLREKRTQTLTANELCEIAEMNEEFKLLINEAQQAAGWMFNTSEIEIVASLYSTLRLSTEYILTLIGYFVGKRERPLRYLEKVAYSLIDEGVDSAPALEEKLRWLEKFEGHAGKVRTLFGIGARELTAREKDYLVNWFDVYGFGDDMVALAYEKTVHSTGKASLAYANGILKKWHDEGVKTPADVEKGGKGTGGKTAAQSYDVEDAFTKALARSYANGEKK